MSRGVILPEEILKAEPTKVEPKKVEPEVQNPEEGEDVEEFDFMQALRDFFNTYKEDIGTIIRALGKNIEEGPRMKMRAMYATFLMLGFIISVLAYLTYLEILNGEAIAFVCGTIIGYLFSFLKTYMVGR